jgi:hypothetical protein
VLMQFNWTKRMDNKQIISNKLNKKLSKKLSRKLNKN